MGIMFFRGSSLCSMKKRGRCIYKVGYYTPDKVGHTRLSLPPHHPPPHPPTTTWTHSPSTNTWIAEDAYYELASGHVVHEACRIRGSHWWGVFGQTCSYVNNEGKMQYGCENKFDEGECLSGEW
jgi:hypothetical protein